MVNQIKSRQCGSIKHDEVPHQLLNPHASKNRKELSVVAQARITKKTPKKLRMGEEKDKRAEVRSSNRTARTFWSSSRSPMVPLLNSGVVIVSLINGVV